jgi:hypothetical protein
MVPPRSDTTAFGHPSLRGMFLAGISGPGNRTRVRCLQTAPTQDPHLHQAAPAEEC